MKSKLSLTIDVGTSNVKFFVTNEKFEEIYFKSIRFNFVNDTLIKEVDPCIWENILLKELKNIFKYDFSNHISNICTTAQMHTTIFLDKQNKPVRKAIMWNDKRGKDSYSKIKEELKECGKLYESSIISNGNPLVNLLWVKKNEESNYKNIKKICFVKDYVNLILTGKIATDYSDASTSGLFNFEKKEWDNEILQYYDIKKEILPEIKKSDDIVGNISELIKEKIGIKRDISVLVGMADNAATFYAIQKLKTGSMAISLGTSAVLISNLNELSLNSKNIVLVTKNEDYLCGQYSISTSGSAIDWRNKIIESTEFISEEEIKYKDLLDNNIIFIPYLNGEKYILKNPNMNGAFLGLTLESDRKDFSISILEGIAFGLKLLYENNLNENLYDIVLVGGGSKNTLWTKILATIMDKEVIKYDLDLMSVHGAALLALGDNNIRKFKNTVRYSYISPENELSNHYIKKYNKFKEYTKLLNFEV